MTLTDEIVRYIMEETPNFRNDYYGWENGAKEIITNHVNTIIDKHVDYLLQTLPQKEGSVWAELKKVTEIDK